MTHAIDPSETVGSGAPELRSKWWLFMLLGVGLLVLGFIALSNILVATVASVFYVGVMMMAAGIAEIIHAFSVRTWGSFALWLLSGIVYAVGGFLAFYNPVLAASVLTLLLAGTLIVAGILRFWVGFQSRPEQGWGWVVFSGLITLLAGFVLAIGWPFNTLWVLGLVLAIDLTMQGAALVAFGFGLKRGVH
jgi:uncharacterized membrane protein HdeD (DUF308 family)